MGTSAELALLRAYEPVIRFTAGELFLPTAVAPYVRRCSLWAGDPQDAEGGELVVEPGGLTLDRLADLGRERRGSSLHLRFVAEPLRGAAMRRWRAEDRPRLRGAGRFAAVGVLARLVDSLLRLSLLLRGRVPGGLAAAAEVASREHLPAAPAYHGRVVRDGGYTVLQYWYFSVFNDWRSTFAGVNDHEADWELVCVYLADCGPDGRPEPRWVAASCHDHAGDELRRRWDDPALQREGDHPVVFAGAGSHAGYFTPGDHVVSVELPVLRRAVDGLTRTWRRLAPWSDRSPSGDAFALPFLDYARGDGPVVGPGHPVGWTAVVVDDDTPWVRDFRGLWGLDTQDAVGGERAPAGPRYERAGAVRSSWADPLGWVGLQKAVPGEQEAEALLASHAAVLDEQLRRLDDDIAAERTELRSLAVQIRSLDGHADLRPLLVQRRAELTRRERELAGTVAERSGLAEQIAVHRDRLARPAVPEPPDAHLRRRVPVVARHRERQRFLRVWAAFSTPLLVVAVVVLLAGPPLAFLTSLAVVVVLFLGVEAVARGRLLAFLTGLVLTALTAAALAALVIGLLRNWQAVLAVLLGLAAAVLLVVNLRELRRG